MPTPLNDGRLRYLYDLNSSGGGTLLRGQRTALPGQPLRVHHPAVRPGQAEPAGWQLGRNDANGQRVTEVYDEAGQLIWSGSGAWRAALAGETLALEPGSAAVDVGPSGVTGCRLIDTASGTEYALPAETSGCIPTGAGQAVLTLSN